MLSDQGVCIISKDGIVEINYFREVENRHPEANNSEA